MNENDKPMRPIEQEAVRTTIVGGRPPGCGKGIGNVPRGVEVLVKKAAVDPAFRAALLEQRAKAAGLIGLALTPAEAAMLDAVPRAQLEAIIERTTVHPSQLPAFLGMAAGVMLVALGATGCERTFTLGVRPDRMPDATRTADNDLTRTAGLRAIQPPTTDNATQPPTSRGIQPDVPLISKGVQPDRPPAKPPTDNVTAPPREGK